MIVQCFGDYKRVILCFLEEVGKQRHKIEQNTYLRALLSSSSIFFVHILFFSLS
ncbi:hypothetical protein JHK82_017899 [Glycine max]|nr:hypothetical protein JHK82_017899 [Glycine max]